MKTVGMVGWWVAWSVMASYRLFQVAMMIYTGKTLGWFLFVPELLALALGVTNAFVAKDRDYRLVGLWVPFCYAVGIFVISSHALYSSPLAVAVFVVAEGLSVWALWNLGTRFSVAGAAWVSLCDGGPYRWVRHPQLAARLLFILACTIPSRDWIGLVVATAMTVSVVLVEEGHLMGKGEYVGYTARVPYRLIPGVF